MSTSLACENVTFWMRGSLCPIQSIKRCSAQSWLLFRLFAQKFRPKDHRVFFVCIKLARTIFFYVFEDKTKSHVQLSYAFGAIENQIEFLLNNSGVRVYIGELKTLCLSFSILESTRKYFRFPNYACKLPSLTSTSVFLISKLLDSHLFLA